MISDKFVILGALLNLWGCAVYARDTIRGNTKPNRVTWGLWALAPLVAFAAEINKGVGLVSLMTFSVGFGPLFVFAASFKNKKSYWRLHAADYFCGFLSLLGLALWLIYQNGNIAIVLNIFADLAAGAPTLVKSFRNPETENIHAYWPAIINAGLTLLAVKTWTIANYGFPIYILLVNVAFVAFIKFKLGSRLQTRKHLTV